MSSATLDAVVGALLRDAAVLVGGAPQTDRLLALERRIASPLRVALAGRVKAGKSTLLNALVGQRVAPTDAGECTRIVTWYVDGRGYLVWLHPQHGAPRQVPFQRRDGQLEINLVGHRPEHVSRLRVQVPTRRLSRITLIDTPGMASMSTAIAERTRTLLTDDAADDSVDAVVYLLRHAHSSDVRFLEAFGDQAFAGTAPVSAIGVLSRADEIGGGDADALSSARTAAAHLRAHPALRMLVQTVVPVAGLLAETAATLREAEYSALATVAHAPRDVRRRMLLSVDLFAADDADVSVSAQRRTELLRRLGLFGVRTSINLIAMHKVRTASELAAALLERSGLPDLQSVLLNQFTYRRALLKAERALAAVEDAVEGDGRPRARELRRRAEAIRASAHGFAELRLLNELRTDQHDLSDDDRDRAEILLGAAGHSITRRLGLADDADDATVRAALQRAHERWQIAAESGATSSKLRRASYVLRRTCEVLLSNYSPRDELR